ncbi:hypothetical protein BGZ94_001785, partial [Podila epigama]
MESHGQGHPSQEQTADTFSPFHTLQPQSEEQPHLQQHQHHNPQQQQHSMVVMSPPLAVQLSTQVIGDSQGYDTPYSKPLHHPMDMYQSPPPPMTPNQDPSDLWTHNATALAARSSFHNNHVPSRPVQPQQQQQQEHHQHQHQQQEHELQRQMSEPFSTQHHHYPHHHQHQHQHQQHHHNPRFHQQHPQYRSSDPSTPTSSESTPSLSSTASNFTHPGSDSAGGYMSNNNVGSEIGHVNNGGATMQSPKDHPTYTRAGGNPSASVTSSSSSASSSSSTSSGVGVSLGGISYLGPSNPSTTATPLGLATWTNNA